MNTSMPMRAWISLIGPLSTTRPHNGALVGACGLCSREFGYTTSCKVVRR